MRLKKLAPPLLASYRRLFHELCVGVPVGRGIHGRSGTAIMRTPRPSNDCGYDRFPSVPAVKVCHNGSEGRSVSWVNSRCYSSSANSEGPVSVDPSSLMEEEYFHDIEDHTLHNLQEKIERIEDDPNDDEIASGYVGDRRRYTSGRKTLKRRQFGVTKEKLEFRREIIRNLVHNIVNLDDVKLVGKVLSEWVKEYASRRESLVMVNTDYNGNSSAQSSTGRFLPYSEVARIVHAVLQIVGEQGNLEGALEVVRWMERQGWCKLDPHLYTTIIDTFGEAGCLELAEKIFSSVNISEVEKDIALFNAMINARGKAGQIDSLEDLFESMKKSFYKPDLVTYNTVMNSYVKAGMGLGTVVSVFKDMYTQGIEPDIVSFNILLEACVSGSHVKEAQKIFDNLKRRGLKPTVITYTTLITVYANSGHCSDALLLLSEMLAHNCLPNAVTFSSLITACARDGVYEEAEKLFQVMKDFQVEPNVVTYNAMIDLNRKRGDCDSAKRLYQEMNAAGLQPTSITAASLMSAYKASGNYDEVFATYEEAKLGKICNTHVFTEAVDACIKSGNLMRILDIQSDMLAVNCHPDVVTCSIILSALGSKCSSEEEACVLVDFLQAFDIELMANSCRMLLEIMISDEEVQKNIHKLYVLLDKEDIKTWTVFSCAMVDALWALGWYRRATLVVAWVMEKGLFDEICVIQPREWKLDLRRLSSGAALVALYQWFGHLALVARHLESVKLRKMLKDETVEMSSEVENDSLDQRTRMVTPETSVLVEVLLPLLPRLEDILPDKGTRPVGRSHFGLQCPPLVTVVTGWGKLSREEGSSIVRTLVQREFVKLRAPFKPSADSGKWMCRGESLMRWLLNPSTGARLVLSDVVPEAERAQ
ncbi:protein MpPPR_10 [Marchantia polymorpha subsp. ruderalis]|uniref:Smr domain-containing protein n=2 Tax=Marchantia polymorpha TaxID=3197 RepID=A0A176VLC7_MARPO|nr:hypothetical protein AXG93_3873s1240 [Marchantia polymorpha subsp. ruderalis]PTQ47131.1 hypothetical protein MARPO_0009s0209 [Marchantia polymorpha]BBN17525.1 hypothetical protein Mp_7g15250 [Marchantia polymorpha subsp. ruderalis]|eukprot:PTQ47131.1 hypothetical protein MARPO_0009s0209 [Marchantia polymorpha]